MFAGDGGPGFVRVRGGTRGACGVKMMLWSLLMASLSSTRTRRLVLVVMVVWMMMVMVMLVMMMVMMVVVVTW